MPGPLPGTIYPIWSFARPPFQPIGMSIAWPITAIITNSIQGVTNSLVLIYQDRWDDLANEGQQYVNCINNVLKQMKDLQCNIPNKKDEYILKIINWWNNFSTRLSKYSIGYIATLTPEQWKNFKTEILNELYEECQTAKRLLDALKYICNQNKPASGGGFPFNQNINIIRNPQPVGPPSPVRTNS